MDLFEFEEYNKVLHDFVLNLADEYGFIENLTEVEVVEPIGSFEVTGIDDDGDILFEADLIAVGGAFVLDELRADESHG